MRKKKNLNLIKPLKLHLFLIKKKIEDPKTPKTLKHNRKRKIKKEMKMTKTIAVSADNASGAALQRWTASARVSSRPGNWRRTTTNSGNFRSRGLALRHLRSWPIARRACVLFWVRESVWDTTRWRSGGLEPLGTYTLTNGEGHPPVDALGVQGCSAHWAHEHPSFHDGGLVAMAAYSHGVRLLDIGSDGKPPSPLQAPAYARALSFCR